MQLQHPPSHQHVVTYVTLLSPTVAAAAASRVAGWKGRKILGKYREKELVSKRAPNKSPSLCCLEEVFVYAAHIWWPH